jgi:hypothetical protein
MKLWNVYLATYEKGAVSRYVGQWSLFAHSADSDDWHRPRRVPT